VNSTLRWRIIATVLVVGFFSYYAIANFVPEETRLESRWLPDEGLRLGLDLRGGIHWVLGAKLDVAEKNELEYLRDAIKEDLKEKGLAVPGIQLDEQKLQLVFEPTEGVDFSEVRSEISDRFGTLKLVSGGVGGAAPVYALTPQYRKSVRENAMKQVLEVLRRRIDDPINGIQDSVVARNGEDRILVQIPGGQMDRNQAEKLIKVTGHLEFKIVDAAAGSEEELRAQYPNGLPEGTQIVTSRERAGGAYLVPSFTSLTGAHLSRASIRMDPRAGWVVDFVFDQEGTKIFRELTKRENQGKQLAIILDDKVFSAPSINEPIPGGRGYIHGNFTSEEAGNLAVILRSGSLSIPIGIEEERTIGPALGADSIRSGLRASIVGLVIVLAFMCFYYRLGGVYSGISLIVNMFVLLGVMTQFRATLTLPGIAGLVLTIGMAVDANVLILERVREELRLGKSPRAAIETGFNRALWTILDANITTLITAIVLFHFGTGPIKGFAVTLSIGIVTSVLAALVVTRLLFALYPGDRRVATVSV